MSDNGRAKLIEEWVRFGGEDLAAARELASRGSYHHQACLLCQQSAEKYLKALLVFHQKPFLKVHDLLDLETRLLETEPDVKTLHQGLVSLNRYYIETRYPGDYPDFSWQDADEAFKAASNVANFVKQRIHP